MTSEPGNVNTGDALVQGSEYLLKLETALSAERTQTYLVEAGNDRTRALRLYTWNTAVSAAFYGPLQGLEVALRNAIHRELTARYGAAWHDAAGPGFDHVARERLEAAKRDLQRQKLPVDPPHLVAVLSFGFWVSLLGRNKADYEMTLWRPALRRAFPHASSLNMKNAHRRLNYLRKLRNRIAHHEPVFMRDLAQDFQSILTVTGWISPAMRDWIELHSRVEAILQTPRDATDISF